MRSIFVDRGIVEAFELPLGCFGHGQQESKYRGRFGSFSRRADPEGQGETWKTPLPGLGPEDVSLTAGNGFLKIDLKTDDEETFTTSLPERVDTDRITAKVDKGILTLSLPYRDESRVIPVS